MTRKTYTKLSNITQGIAIAISVFSSFVVLITSLLSTFYFILVCSLLLIFMISCFVLSSYFDKKVKHDKDR